MCPLMYFAMSLMSVPEMFVCVSFLISVCIYVYDVESFVLSNTDVTVYARDIYIKQNI